MSSSIPRYPNPLSYVQITLAVLAVFVAAIIIGCIIWIEYNFIMMIQKTPQETWSGILKDHIQAIIGLQVAAAVSFALVVILHHTEAPAKIDMLGFKFEGAAGQVVMWIICFLTIAAAIKMCWSV